MPLAFCLYQALPQGKRIPNKTKRSRIGEAPNIVAGMRCFGCKVELSKCSAFIVLSPKLHRAHLLKQLWTHRHGARRDCMCQSRLLIFSFNHVPLRRGRGMLKSCHREDMVLLISRNSVARRRMTSTARKERGFRAQQGTGLAITEKARIAHSGHTTDFLAVFPNPARPPAFERARTDGNVGLGRESRGSLQSPGREEVPAMGGWTMNGRWLIADSIMQQASL